MRLTATVLTALLIALLLPTVPGSAAPPKGDPVPDKDAFELGEKVDLPLFFKELQNMEGLRVEARRLQVAIHDLMVKITEQPDKEEEKALRGAIHERLLGFRRIKTAHIDKVNPIIRHVPGKLSDVDILVKLRDTSLGSVDWEDKYFRDCVSLISKSTGVNIIWNKSKIQQFNGVYLRLPNLTASCALRFICHGFDLKTIIYQGDMYIVKKVDRNENRFVRYEKKHGKVDYWRFEPDEIVKVEGGRRVPQTVFDMNLDLLRMNLLKFFVIEDESRVHQEQLKQLKFIKQAVEADQLQDPDPQFMKLAKKRERHILHYMSLEKEGAIEILDIIHRILGDRARLTDKDSEWRRILETPIKDLAWKQLPLDQALIDLGKKVNVPVIAEIPLIQVPYITLTIDRGTFETAVQMIQDIHPLKVVYRKGKILFFVE